MGVVAAAVGVSLTAPNRVLIRNPKKLYIMIIVIILIFLIIMIEIRIIDNSNNSLINA